MRLRNVVFRGAIPTVLCALMWAFPCVALANPYVKCLQRELKETGHNPRGIDGVLGPNTIAAATRWGRRAGVNLPNLSDETAARWCAALLSAGNRLPAASPGTERFCIWFPEVHNGVWLDPEGEPRLLFRYASQEDGAGCYGWLNEASDWQITETGTQILRVERDGKLWASGDEENGIIIDSMTGAARYLRNGFETPGILLD